MYHLIQYLIELYKIGSQNNMAENVAYFLTASLRYN